MLKLRRLLLVLAAACALLPMTFGRVYGQDNDTPSFGDLASAVVESVSSMFSALLTPYEPSTGLADVYADIPHSRGADGAFILGDPSAPVTLIEFSDWACPHCQAYKPVIDQFIDEYVRSGQARYERRMFPTAGGQMTIQAAQYSECADEQRSGAFWSASEALYDLAETGQYNANLGRELAKRLNLDYTELASCQATAKQVETDYNYGYEVGVNGTPAVLIQHGDDVPAFITRGDRTYSGGGVPYDVLQFIMEGGGRSA